MLIINLEHTEKYKKTIKIACNHSTHYKQVSILANFKNHHHINLHLLHRPANRQHTKSKGLAILRVRGLSAVIFELGIRNSEISKNLGEAPEMPPTASVGNLFANQSCRNSGRPAY